MAWEMENDVPNQHEVAEYWYCRDLPGSDYIPLTDISMPICFSCGWHSLIDNNSTETADNPWKGIQLTHVIPPDLGGPNAPWNVVPLCGACHNESPKTAYADKFWQWLLDHSDKNPQEQDLRSRREEVDWREYRGRHQKSVNALAFLASNDLEFLSNLLEHESLDQLLHLMKNAQQRIGGIFMGEGMTLSSRDLAKILQEVIRYERDKKNAGGEPR